MDVRMMYGHENEGLNMVGEEWNKRRIGMKKKTNWKYLGKCKIMNVLKQIFVSWRIGKLMMKYFRN